MEAQNNESDTKKNRHKDFENIPYNGFFTNNGESSSSYSGSVPGSRNMLFGLIWILIGAGITWYLLEAAVQGQSFVLPVVVVVFGVVQLCKGVGQFFTHPDEW